MFYREYACSPGLVPYVECFWTLRTRGDGSWEPIYPDGCGELVFNLSDPAEELRANGVSRQPRTFVYGQLEERIRIRNALETNVLAIRLRPWAARVLLGVPAKELTGRSTPLGAISRGLERRLVSTVATDTPIEHKVRKLDEDLRSWLGSHECEIPAAAAVARYLQRTPHASVCDVTRLTGWSARTAQRHFQSDVGVSPKRFVQVVRFMRFVRLLELEPESPLAYLAGAAGYYDQPHLHRDCRRFTGETPASFRATRGTTFDHLYGRERLEDLVTV